MMEPIGFVDIEEGKRHARARRAFEARQREMLAAFRRDKGLPQPLGIDGFEVQPATPADSRKARSQKGRD